jgi:hypothetical protein
MAKNTGSGHRSGIVKNRKQTYNPKTGQYVKRDTTTGKIVSCKDTPYKNVRKDDNAKAKHESSKSKESPKKTTKKTTSAKA